MGSPQVPCRCSVVCRQGSKSLAQHFKHGSDDLRESPYLELAERLLGRGFELKIYDPDLDPARLRAYGILPDSCGAGRYRGGCGIVREYDILAEEATMASRTFGLVLAALVLGSGAQAGDREARVSLDLKDALVVDIVSVLAQVGGFQVVFDPGISCRLTMKINQARWRSVLDTALSACDLGREDEGDILRIAPVSKLEQEAGARRKLDEERRTAPVGRVEWFRLSYARAQEMASLLQKTLPPTARVTYDRTGAPCGLFEQPYDLVG